MKIKEGIIKRKEVDYWVCKRCKITSADKKRMCPCPRGGCEAECVGKLVKTKEVILNKK